MKLTRILINALQFANPGKDRWECAELLGKIMAFLAIDISWGIICSFLFLFLMALYFLGLKIGS